MFSPKTTLNQAQLQELFISTLVSTVEYDEEDLTDTFNVVNDKTYMIRRFEGSDLVQILDHALTNTVDVSFKGGLSISMKKAFENRTFNWKPKRYDVLKGNLDIIKTVFASLPPVVHNKFSTFLDLREPCLESLLQQFDDLNIQDRRRVVSTLKEVGINLNLKRGNTLKDNKLVAVYLALALAWGSDHLVFLIGPETGLTFNQQKVLLERLKQVNPETYLLIATQSPFFSGTQFTSCLSEAT